MLHEYENQGSPHVKRAYVPLVSAIALSVGACTTDLDVTKVAAGNQPPASSWTYFLPFEQFDLTATRTFTGCDAATGNPKLSLAVAGTASVQPDPDQFYSIDPFSLASPTKIWDLKISWFTTSGTPSPATAPAKSSGASALGGTAAAGTQTTQPAAAPTESWMLHSINASAEDRTAQTITAALTSIGTLATTIAAHGTGAAAAPICGANGTVNDPALSTALAAKKGLDAAVQAANDRVASATQRLNLMTSLSSAGGSRLDAATITLLAGGTEAVTKAVTAQKKAAQNAAANQAKLTATYQFTWPRNGELTNGVQQIKVPGGKEAVFKLLHVALTPKDADQDLLASLRMELVQQPAKFVPGAAQALEGIRYRAPVGGHLIVCMTPPPAEGKGIETADGALACDRAPVTGDYVQDDSSRPIWSGATPQLGQIMALPYHNGPFQNNLMAATFNPDGSLASAEYGAKTATAETIASTLSDSSKALSSGIKGVVTGPTTYEQAQVAAYTARNNLITQQDKLTTADQAGVLQANTALLTAQTNYDDAQVALAKAQASLKSQ